MCCPDPEQVFGKKEVQGNTGLKCDIWASMVAQLLRILLPMQGTRVRALVREDPTCRGATTEPVL